MKKTAFIIAGILATQSAFSQIINFGHTQHSGRHTASFGVLRTEYDDYTDPLYWNTARHTQDLYPAAYGGMDENYWNAGASAEYGTLFASLVFYEQIANYKDWPSNMTDLGLAVTLGIDNTFAVQGRYYDFCYSGGKGTAMPGGTVSAILGDGAYKHRVAAGLDWSFWFLKPNDADLMFPRIYAQYERSRNSSTGFGLKYLAVLPVAGTANQTPVGDVAVSHTLSLWTGITADKEQFTVGVRPNGFITFNAANPTKNFTDDADNYTPYADSGNLEFLIRLPACISYHITDSIEIIASAQFGLYYASFDHVGYSGLGGNNRKGWVNENGVGLGMNFTVGERCSLQIGSSFIRIPELTGEETSSNPFENHLYTAQNVSAKNLADAPLSVSGRFLF